MTKTRKVVGYHIHLNNGIITSITYLDTVRTSRRYIVKLSEDEFKVYSSVKFGRRFSKVVIINYIRHCLSLVKVDANTNETTVLIGKPKNN